MLVGSTCNAHVLFISGVVRSILKLTHFIELIVKKTHNGGTFYAWTPWTL